MEKSHYKTHLVLGVRWIICKVQVVLAITPLIIAPLWYQIRVTAHLIRSQSLRRLKSCTFNQDRGDSGMLRVFKRLINKSKLTILCTSNRKRSSKRRRDKNNRQCFSISTNQLTALKCVGLKSSRNGNNIERNQDKRSSIRKMRHRSIALSRSTKNKLKRQVTSKF